MDNDRSIKFELQEYKSHLISYYRWPCDRKNYNDRANYINSHYSDDYLKNIITNTQDFIPMLIQKMANENHTYEENIFNIIELPPFFESSTEFISNGCLGGWPSDSLFYLDNNNKETLISLYVLKKFFGNKFRIWLGSKDYEDFNPDEQAGVEYSIPTFEISGPLDEFNKIYNKTMAETNQKKLDKKLFA